VLDDVASTCPGILSVKTATFSDFRLDFRAAICPAADYLLTATSNYDSLTRHADRGSCRKRLWPPEAPESSSGGIRGSYRRAFSGAGRCTAALGVPLASTAHWTSQPVCRPISASQRQSAAPAPLDVESAMDITPTTICGSDLAADTAALQWYEAVAFVLQLAEAIKRVGVACAPDLPHVQLSTDGTVAILHAPSGPTSR